MDVIHKNLLIVAPQSGGTVALVDRKSGEVFGEIPLPAGEVNPRSLMEYQTENVGLEFGPGVWVTEKRCRVGVIHHPEGFSTAAVPDYQPSVAATQSRIFAQQLTRQAADNARMMAQYRAEMNGKMSEELAKIKKAQEQEEAEETTAANPDDAKP